MCTPQRLKVASSPGTGRATSSRVKSASDASVLEASTDKLLGIEVYFYELHATWQRGSNENMSGVVRQYLTNGTNLSVHSQEQLDARADEINERPRIGLDVRSHLAVYRDLLINSPQPSSIKL